MKILMKEVQIISNSSTYTNIDYKIACGEAYIFITHSAGTTEDQNLAKLDSHQSKYGFC